MRPHPDRAAWLISAGLLVSLAIIAGLFIAVFQGSAIAERLHDQLYQREAV